MQNCNQRNVLYLALPRIQAVEIRDWKEEKEERD